MLFIFIISRFIIESIMLKIIEILILIKREIKIIFIKVGIVNVGMGRRNFINRRFKIIIVFVAVIFLQLFINFFLKR